MTVEEGFRGPVICRVVGITYRQLDYWARTDFITPSVTEARGSGTQRRYSRADLRSLLVTKTLLDSGLSLNFCRRVVAAMTPDAAYAAVAGGSVHVGNDTDGHQLVKFLLAADGPATFINLAAIDATIRDRLREAS